MRLWTPIQPHVLGRRFSCVQAVQSVQRLLLLIPRQGPDLKQAQLTLLEAELDVPRQDVVARGICGRIQPLYLGHHLTKLPDFVRHQYGVAAADRNILEISAGA